MWVKRIEIVTRGDLRDVVARKFLSATIAFGLGRADLIIRRFNENILATHVLNDMLLLVVEVPRFIETPIVYTVGDRDKTTVRLCSKYVCWTRGICDTVVDDCLKLVACCRSFGDSVTKLLAQLVSHLICQLLGLLVLILLTSLLLGFVTRRFSTRPSLGFCLAFIWSSVSLCHICNLAKVGAIFGHLWWTHLKAGTYRWSILIDLDLRSHSKRSDILLAWDHFLARPAITLGRTIWIELRSWVVVQRTDDVILGYNSIDRHVSLSGMRLINSSHFNALISDVNIRRLEIFGVVRKATKVRASFPEFFCVHVPRRYLIWLARWMPIGSMYTLKGAPLAIKRSISFNSLSLTHNGHWRLRITLIHLVRDRSELFGWRRILFI